MKWKSLFAAAFTAAVALPAWPQEATGGGIPFTNGRSISVNFATGQSNVTNNVSGDALFGLDEVAVAGSQWNNATGSSGENVALKVSGAASGATLTFRAGATWSVNDSSSALGNTNPLLGSFLDDGTAITVDGDNSTFAAEITVSGIPFETYDVYLYSNVNNGSGFKPIQVNGTYYTYADGATVSTKDTSAQWGATEQTTPQLGRNVLVVSGVTGDALTIRTLKRIMQGNVTSNIPRGSFAGFQIVERVPPTISVNFIGASGMTSIKAKSGVSGLVGVANANWNEGASSGTGASANNAETDMALVDNQGTVTPATLTYAMGGAWVAGTNGARNALLGEMGKGYCDNPTTTNTIDLRLRNIPYTSYSLILYYGTDKDAASIPWSAPKVTDADGVSKWYSYPANHEGKAAQASDAEVTSWGSVRNKTGAYGDDVMLIENLSGDIDVDLGVRRDNGIYGSLCGFQIICTGEVVGALAPSSVMSLNFASGGTGEIATSTVSDQTGNFGLAAVPAGTWVDLTGNENADRKTVTTLYGEADVADWAAATVTWDAQNSYSYKTGQVTDETEPFLKTYLDDGGSGASVNVDNLPFAAYDVIVYNATDSGKAFYPVTVNSVPYTWDDTFGTIATEGTSATYGHGQNEPDAVAGLPTATLGVNALRVDGLTASALSIQGARTNIGGNSETYVRAGIAAVQIVARKLITVSTQTDWTTLSAGLSASDPVLIVFQNGGSITGDVTLPADTILDFSGYTFGETAPFTDSLTMNGGTIRLPDGFESGRIATFFSGNNFHCFIAGKPVWLSKNPGDGALSVSYMWTGYAGDNRWSTPGNWSSLVVPGKNADVLFMPAASRPETVILDKAATVASVTITGSESSAATLEIQAEEGGSLTVSGRMLATGNVTVTQSANITVQGTTETYSTGVGYPEQPCQAGFHVHGATWKVASGTLSMPTDDGANTGEAGISGGGTLIVGGEVASNATLAVRQIRPIMYGQALTSANGTLRVAAGGTLTATEAVTLAVSYGQPYTVDLAGGAIETLNLRTFTGVTVSDASTLRAPEGGALAVTASGSNDALTGAGGVTLSGAVTIASALATYSGTLTVSAGSALTLSGNARPSLVLEDGVAEDKKTALTVTTPSTGEAALGEIVFTTAMKAEPANVDYTVAGKEVTASVADGTLKLSWAVAYPTLAQTGDWSEAEKWTTGTAPATGVAILDGTSAPIRVTLDTALTGTETEMSSIVVRGDVTLVTTNDQPTIPACVTLAEGATLGVGATSFGDTWALPAGTTLRIENAGFSLANIQTVNSYTQFAGNVEIVFSDGSIGDLAKKPIRIDGTLSIKGNNVTFTNLGLLAGDVDLLGNRICLDRERHAQGDGANSGALGIGSDGTTTLTNCGDGNRIAHATRLNGTIDVQSGSLALLTEQPGDISTTSPAYHATIAEGATLILEENCAGGQYPATGAGTYAVGTNRPQFAAVGGATTTPAIITATATAEEQSAGTITFANYQSAVSFPEGFEAKIKSYGAAAPWVTVAKAGGNTLQILNVPAPNGLSGLNDAVALTLRQAAAKEGITNGDYTVRLTTGGGRQTVDVTAAALNDVLGCFTGLKATANSEKTTLTYAYDFGIVGIARNAGNNGWVVTAQVQGAPGAAAGFAEGNVYTLTVNGAPAADASATVGENGTVTFTVPDASVAGETCTLGVKVARPAAQP